MSDAEYQPRMRWRKTWEDRENDFVAHIPGALDTLGYQLTSIGRIMKVHATPHLDGKWQWMYQASFPDLPWVNLNRGGYVDTPREASRMIEDTWFRAIVGTPYEGMVEAERAQAEKRKLENNSPLAG